MMINKMYIESERLIITRNTKCLEAEKSTKLTYDIKSLQLQSPKYRKTAFLSTSSSHEYDIKVNMTGNACHIYVAYNLIQREKWYICTIYQHHATQCKK